MCCKSLCRGPGRDHLYSMDGNATNALWQEQNHGRIHSDAVRRLHNLSKTDEIDRIPSYRKRSISWERGVIGTSAGKEYRAKQDNKRNSISSTNPYAHIFSDTSDTKGRLPKNLPLIEHSSPYQSPDAKQ